MIEKMWEILTTLTEESRQAALSKCVELGLDQNRGVVSLDESFINLNAARHILMDAIEQNKLIQLPITVQKVLVANLEAISKFQTGLIAGTDEVLNLVNAIEQLNTAIWQYGLHNLSEEVLGYQSKLNQLKNLELEAREHNQVLNEGLQLKEKIEQLLADASNQSDLIQRAAVSANESASGTNKELTNILDASQKASALLTTIQQNEVASTQQLAATNKSNAEIASLEKKIVEFFGNIDEYKEKMSGTADNAKKSVQENNDATSELISTLKELEGQIKEQIQKATGHSLFHSFQTRQDSLSGSKVHWIYALVALIFATLGLTIYVINTTTDINAAFFLKLSMSIPLIFAITFCTVQYSRERRLEEEYAFKSNISISLIPYQELVEKLVDKNQLEERQRYAAFIMDAITKVFTSPTEKIFDNGEKRHNKSGDETIKQLGSTIQTVVETVAKAIK
ncbi:MAG: hypothetical protein ACD_23C01398G0002 [uncultured bacterium]|nr:MAG: hypothetical protein ACD_23C01398G0002 [uncultured bacterium]HCM68275.1 hypothetical protein [Candidatus Kerfeldbacteria bacterium]